MNVHHLELFYFVAKFEGITEAVRNMPYGIQQPAVSGQISKLEGFLGVKLFQRRPFALTPAGEELYDFIYPFFSRLDQMTERLRGEESHHLRLAASAAALTHHLPEVLQALRSEFPALRLTLRELRNPEIETALRKMEADVAVAILHRKSTPGLKSVKLIDIPLAIAAPECSPIEKFRELTTGASGGQIQHPLITLPRIEPASQLFQQGLNQRNLRWEPSMEVSELGLIQNYVAKGFGFGIAVDIPGAAWPEGVKKIRLPKDFPPLTIGALHTGDLKAVAKRFIDLAGDQANKLLEAKKTATKGDSKNRK
ncbi:MAG: LysR family transcriptional regulator [Verrucomicrobiales bacterium]|nr:LysR family transcriptional regulator [Verrucomicrobiales bacterium]